MELRASFMPTRYAAPVRTGRATGDRQLEACWSIGWGALAGAFGFVGDQASAARIDEIRNAVLEFSRQALTDSAVNKIIEPTIDDVLRGGRYDVISIGFVLALWSGSRALNVFVDTITIMHGLGGHRGIVQTRALSFELEFQPSRRNVLVVLLDCRLVCAAVGADGYRS